jgi:uncharacterized protein YabN with tetrapyrrole methylase and pyrophosphatase domain
MKTTARRGSLVVVGTGIRVIAQTTLEAVAHIKGAETLFYLVSDLVTEGWLKRLNPSARTLSDCYEEGKPRYLTYREIVARIMAAVRSGSRVCAVFYGHPGVLANPAHDAIRQARRAGFTARMLPGVSTEDCLFADLGVDPGDSGCQSYEATEFLMSRRRLDPSSALILWQVGVLGEPSVKPEMSCRPDRLRVLVSALRRYYPARHPVVLYEAAQYPVCEPAIKKVSLSRLPRETVPSMATLYVAPIRSRHPDEKILRWFHQQ